MVKRIGYSLLVVLAAFGSMALHSGCSSTSATVTQIVQNVAWLPNGSGMIALVNNLSTSAVDGSTTSTIGLYHVGLDGTIGNVIGPADQPSYGSSFSVLFVSKDGSTAYTQLGAHIYRFNLLDNSGVPVIQNANILGVSPDGKYLISTDAPFGDKTPLYTIYDVSANPIRFVNHFTPINIWGNRALWIDGGKFALTHEDSLGYTHVSIWDTTNTLVNTLSDADASEATGSYSPGSQALFVRNRAAGIDRIIQPTQSNFIRSSVLSQDSSESMDASADGKLLAYCSAKYSQTYALFAINVQNGHTASLGGSALALFLSPNGDRVAYTHADGANITIQVAGISLPQ